MSSNGKDTTEFITAKDEHQPATQADVKRAAEFIRQGLNQVLSDFQKGMIQAEQRYAFSYNASNAVLKALLDKGLVTEADIVEAGMVLNKEARAHLEEVQAAAKKKAAGEDVEMPQGPQTPLDRLRAWKTEQ